MAGDRDAITAALIAIERALAERVVVARVIVDMDRRELYRITRRTRPLQKKHDEGRPHAD